MAREKIQTSLLRQEIQSRLAQKIREVGQEIRRQKVSAASMAFDAGLTAGVFLLSGFGGGSRPVFFGGRVRPGPCRRSGLKSS